MIKEIQIQNFQSHKNTTLKLNPGVNIITGSSDCGKSVVIRALKWLVYNKPRGDAFRSTWGGKTAIQVKLDKDTILIREKDKENKYEIISKGKSSVFKALGTEIPQEITSILNMDEINLQQQFDSPFLLSQTPGEVSQHFNRIAKLSKINTSLKQIQSWIRKLYQRIDNEEENLLKAQTNLSTYDYLPEVEQDVISWEGWENEIATINYKLISLQTLKRQAQTLTLDISKEQKIIPAEIILKNITAYYQQKKQIASQEFTIRKLIDDINGAEYKINHLQKGIKAEELITSLLKTFEKQEKTNSLQNNLSTILDDIEDNETEINNTQIKLKGMEKQWKDEFPNVCFLCGQPVEKWKMIPGWEGIYEVSDQGKVRSYYKDAKNLDKTKYKIKMQGVDFDGYKRVMLYGKSKGKKDKNVGVHRLVLLTFKGPCLEGKEASHLDGDRTNNRATNLIWETHLENERRKDRPKVTYSKLTEKMVKEIREIYVPYVISQRELAKKYGVHEETIQKIITNKSWTHI